MMSPFKFRINTLSKSNSKIWTVLLFLLIIVPRSFSWVSAGFIECPGLPTRKGITLECVSTKLGAAKFNCSRPMPVDTVAYYNCEPYYKEQNRFPSLFDAKSMRCNEQGKWARYNHFTDYKCDYECGKAMPTTKTSVIRGQLKTITTWSWHALIYVKLNWAKVLEASHYRRSLFTSFNNASKPNKRNTNDVDDVTDDYGYVGEEFATERNKNIFSMDPLKLAEIFDNEELSREEIHDPRYRYIFICGGTLISENMILTAAHCLTDLRGGVRTPRDFMVVLGATSNSFYTNIEDQRSQIIPVSRIHISDYFSYDEFKSDIAIIQLQQPAVLNSAVLPACLPENGDESQQFIANRKQGEIIGSMINIYKEGISTELKSKKLQVLPNIECIRNIERIPSDKEFCAGNLGVNICSGDSGGGLIANPNFGLKRRYSIQGIVSYGRAGRICENYAVFTRVHKFVDWIKYVAFINATTT